MLSEHGAPRPSRPRSSAQRRDIRGIIASAPAKYCRTRHQHIGASGDRLTGRGGRNSAIDLKSDPAATFGNALSGCLNLAQLAVDKTLATESRVYAHDQNQIDQIEDIIDRLYGRGRIENNSRRLSEASNQLQRSVHVWASLGVDRYDVGTGFGKGLDIGIRRGNHQVAIKTLAAMGAQGANHQRTDREVGYKVTVHHVDVDKIGSRGIDRGDFRAKLREICGQDRRRNTDWGHTYSSAGFSMWPQGTNGRWSQGTTGHFRDRARPPAPRCDNPTARPASSCLHLQVDLRAWAPTLRPDLSSFPEVSMADNAVRSGPRQRPLSPHLQIYHWSPTMMTSIVHRATGVGLSIGMAGLAWWLMALASGPDAYATFGALVFTWVGQIFVFGFVWSLCYHLLSGIRHLAWDFGYGFAPRFANRVSVTIIVLSILLAAGVYLYGLFSFGGM